MRIRLRRLVAATAALVTTAVMLVPTAAHADTNPNCKLVASRIGEAVDLVTGAGRVEKRGGCGTEKIRITIERSRWFGWEPVAEADMPQNGRDYSVSYNCKGSGTHDYRTTIMPVGYAQFAVSSSALKGVVCSR